MNLISNSISIFVSIIFLLVIAALFPSPEIIGVVSLISTALIILQAVIILKDEAPDTDSNQ